MKKLAQLRHLFAVTFVLLAVSCAIPGGPSNHAARLTLNIPTMGTWVKTQLSSLTPVSRSKTLSRALGYVDSIQVTISESNDTPRGTFRALRGADGTWTAASVPTGSNLKVKVEVFNETVSESVPQVEGFAEGVTIVGGVSNTISIVCVPSNPATASASNNLSLSSREEAWYTLPSGSAGTFKVFQDANDEALLGVFDDKGNYLGSGFGGVGVEVPADTAALFLAVLNTTASSIDPIVTVASPTPAGEGLTGDPISLDVGSHHLMVVGSAGGDDTSYYKFTTGSVLSLYDFILPSSEWTYEVYSSSSFTGTPLASGSGSSAAVLLKLLTASTTYYLKVQNTGTDHFYDSVLLEAIPYLPVNAWQEGYLNEGEAQWFAAKVIGGHSYTLYWDDSYEGSGQYDYGADLRVSAYSEHGGSLLYRADSGYDQGWTLKVPSGDTVLLVKVEGYDTDEYGDFAIKLR